MQVAKVTKYKIAFLFLLIVIFLGYYFFYSKHKIQSLLKNHIISKGYTFDYTPGTSYKNNPPSIIYKYHVGNLEFKGSTQLYDISAADIQSKLINKNFAVAIDSTDFSNSMILISPKAFSDMNMVYPDSLSWISSLVKE